MVIIKEPMLERIMRFNEYESGDFIRKLQLMGKLQELSQPEISVIKIIQPIIETDRVISRDVFIEAIEKAELYVMINYYVQKFGVPTLDSENGNSFTS